jgi:hypothetical protein
MKTLDKELQEKLPKIVFVKDDSLARFKGKNLIMGEI